MTEAEERELLDETLFVLHQQGYSDEAAARWLPLIVREKASDLGIVVDDDDVADVVTWAAEQHAAGALDRPADTDEDEE